MYILIETVWYRKSIPHTMQIHTCTYMSLRLSVTSVESFILPDTVIVLHTHYTELTGRDRMTGLTHSAPFISYSNWCSSRSR